MAEIGLEDEYLIRRSKRFISPLQIKVFSEQNNPQLT